MDEQKVHARTRARVRLLTAVIVGFVIVDQVSKWWAWRHVARVTVDIGGGVLDEFVGGLANSVMEDPLVGAVADAVLVAVLVAAAHRLVTRDRSRPVLLAGSALVAAGVSNLLDRLGLHGVTAPGSARGVVNWISFGGSDVSPVNLADLLTTAAVLALGVIQLTRLARDRIPSRRQRSVAVVAAAVVLGVSVAGAAHARNGVLARRAVPQAGVTAKSRVTVAAATRRLDLGTPPASAGTGAWQDDIRQIELDGSTVTVVWASERVSVATRSVLGWRVDGVSALYRHAVVVGPTTVDLYLPPPQSGGNLCLWQPIGPTVHGAPPAWECNAGTPPLRLRPRPVLFS